MPRHVLLHARGIFFWTDATAETQKPCASGDRVTDSTGLLVGAVGIETTKGRHSQGGVKNTREYKGMNSKGKEFTCCPIVPSFF